MTENYSPHYKKNHLRVFFKEGSPEGMPKYLEKKFGYEIVPTEDFDCYTYDVGEDMTSAKENFLKYKEFISGVEKRDLKFEKRLEFKKNLEWEVKGIDEMDSDKKYREYLKKIKESIEGYNDEF